MVEQEAPELIPFHVHTKITTIYRATIDENDLKTSRKDFPQLKIQRRNHREMGRRSGDTVESRFIPLGQAIHKQENNHNCRGSPQGVRGLSPALGSPAWGSCTGEMSPRNARL